MDRKCKWICSGAAAGLANGFFGAGGGLVLVPLLTHWVKIETKNAFASSVLIIVPISILSVLIYLLNNAFRIQTALPYLAGGLIGGVISGKLFRSIRAIWLKRAFGLLCLYGGIRAVLLI